MERGGLAHVLASFVCCGFYLLHKCVVTFYPFLGASACFLSKQFNEAITWCEKGLAVSFTGFY